MLLNLKNLELIFFLNWIIIILKKLTVDQIMNKCCQFISLQIVGGIHAKFKCNVVGCYFDIFSGIIEIQVAQLIDKFIFVADNECDIAHLWQFGHLQHFLANKLRIYKSIPQVKNYPILIK